MNAIGGRSKASSKGYSGKRSGAARETEVREGKSKEEKFKGTSKGQFPLEDEEEPELPDSSEDEASPDAEVSLATIYEADEDEDSGVKKDDVENPELPGSKSASKPASSSNPSSTHPATEAETLSEGEDEDSGAENKKGKLITFPSRGLSEDEAGGEAEGEESDC